MNKDITPLPSVSWHEQLSSLIQEASRIARQHQSPLTNDAQGTLDCYELENKLDDCKKILGKYKDKSSCTPL